MSICSCSMQSISVPVTFIHLSSWTFYPEHQWLGAVWILVPGCVLVVSGDPDLRLHAPPACRAASAGSSEGENSEVYIKRKLRPSRFTCITARCSKRLTNTKPRKEKEKKDARNVRKCFIFSINSYFLILYFFVKWCIATFPSKASVLGFLNPLFIHSLHRLFVHSLYNFIGYLLIHVT